MELAVRVIRGWGVLLGVPALFFAAYFYPHIPLLGSLKLCAVRGFLGCDCPGCGMTRSLWAVAHGRVRESIDFHPLGIIVAGWLLYIFLRSLAEAGSGRRLPALLGRGSRDILVYAFLGALVFQWAVKLWLALS